MAIQKTPEFDIEEIKKGMPQAIKDYRKQHPEIKHLSKSGQQYRFLAFYNISRANVTESCKFARIGKYKYYQKWLLDPDFKRIIGIETEAILDDVESDLFNQARRNVIANIFALKCRRPLKWQDTQEHRISGNITHLTYEQALELLEKKKDKQIQEGEVVKEKLNEPKTTQKSSKGKK